MSIIKNAIVNVNWNYSVNIGRLLLSVGWLSKRRRNAERKETK